MTPNKTEITVATIHPTAVVDESAKLADSVTIGPYSVVGPEVSIGSGTVLHNHVIVQTLTTIGRDNQIYPFTVLGADPQDRKFLAVPLVVGALPTGVLVVQTGRSRHFSEEEIELLEMIAAQVASIVLNARLLDLAFREGRLGPTPTPREVQKLAPGTILRGIPVSAGISVGPVHFQPSPLNLADVPYTPSQSRRAEWRAVERALRETVRQISDLRAAVGERFGEEFAEVFTTHIMILEDAGFREQLRRYVFDHGNGAEALSQTMRRYSDMFAATADPTIRERAADIEDVVPKQSAGY